MASKVPIQLKEYKVRKGRVNGVPQTGHKVVQCIVNVSSDLASYLGVEAYEFPENEGTKVPNPVNVTTYAAYSTGTYHGKTVYIITDGEADSSDDGDIPLYKKTYQMQIPSNYPVQFLLDFLKDRQSSTSNTMRYVKIRNGRRFPIPQTVAPQPGG